MSKNTYEIINIDGEQYVSFLTNGKNKLNVIVDENLWFKYLNKYSWTAVVQKTERIEIKTSINGTSVTIYRLIIENEIDELLRYNRVIDHINNNFLDNRLNNLRLVNTKMNINNKMSKSNNIYKSSGNLFKVHMNINGEIHYKYFKTTEEALKYRDDILIPLKEKAVETMLKKDRDIEFERGLLNKLNSNEYDEILSILEKYKIMKEIS